MEKRDEKIIELLENAMVYIEAARRDNVLSRVKLLLRDEVQPSVQEALDMLESGTERET